MAEPCCPVAAPARASLTVQHNQRTCAHRLPRNYVTVRMHTWPLCTSAALLCARPVSVGRWAPAQSSGHVARRLASRRPLLGAHVSPQTEALSPRAHRLPALRPPAQSKSNTGTSRATHRCCRRPRPRALAPSPLPESCAAHCTSGVIRTSRTKNKTCSTIGASTATVKHLVGLTGDFVPACSPSTPARHSPRSARLAVHIHRAIHTR